MHGEDEFQDALDAQPDAHHVRMIFADWLEERGDVRAEGYRAMGVNRIFPFHGSDDASKGRCPWFYKAGETYSLGFHEDLPGDWFDAVEFEGKSNAFIPCHNRRTEANRREIEDAAAFAFAKLPAERRAELLAGACHAGSV